MFEHLYVNNPILLGNKMKIMLTRINIMKIITLLIEMTPTSDLFLWTISSYRYF